MAALSTWAQRSIQYGTALCTVQSAPLCGRLISGDSTSVCAYVRGTRAPPPTFFLWFARCGWLLFFRVFCLVWGFGGGVGRGGGGWMGAEGVGVVSFYAAIRVCLFFCLAVVVLVGCELGCLNHVGVSERRTVPRSRGEGGPAPELPRSGRRSRQGDRPACGGGGGCVPTLLLAAGAGDVVGGVRVVWGWSGNAANSLSCFAVNGASSEAYAKIRGGLGCLWSWVRPAANGRMATYMPMANVRRSTIGTR